MSPTSFVAGEAMLKVDGRQGPGIAQASLLQAVHGWGRSGHGGLPGSLGGGSGGASHAQFSDSLGKP